MLQMSFGKFANQTGTIICHNCPLGRKAADYEGAISKGYVLFAQKVHTRQQRAR